jgi:hypothetical protein
MKAQVPATVTFKTKVRHMQDGDTGTTFEYIDYKRELSRHDCNLKPHQHDYYNSDLFPSMLKRAYETAIGGRPWVRLSCLPENVTVNSTGFLAIVTVRINV